MVRDVAACAFVVVLIILRLSPGRVHLITIRWFIVLVMGFDLLVSMVRRAHGGASLWCCGALYIVSVVRLSHACLLRLRAGCVERTCTGVFFHAIVSLFVELLLLLLTLDLSDIIATHFRCPRGLLCAFVRLCGRVVAVK